jgi:protein-tyrosine-phosphatase
MAEATVNTLTRRMKLPFQAQSAGTSALKGEHLAPNAMAALVKIGLYMTGQVTVPGKSMRRYQEGLTSCSR